jgi:hypothetical protein
MNTTILRRLASIVAIALALGSQGLAQTAEQRGFAGSIHDYTAALDANGPWHIAGEWSVRLKGDSGRGDFWATLTMARAESATREHHTHHITLRDGHVTLLANGFRISGSAVITGNGNLAGFSGSPIDVELTGGNAVPFSNLSLTFGGTAVNHFGAQALHGVVTEQR